MKQVLKTMWKYYIYILKCKDGSYYIGQTNNVESRVNTHKLGVIKGCYTYKRRPLELVYVASFATRKEAFAAERQIKNWSRKKKEALILGKFDLLQTFAKKSFNRL